MLLMTNATGDPLRIRAMFVKEVSREMLDALLMGVIGVGIGNVRCNLSVSTIIYHLGRFVRSSICATIKMALVQPFFHLYP